MTRGYARVSTADQTLETQITALTAAGAEVVYQEKISGAREDRPELIRLMSDMQPGDVLLVCALDRLARSTLQILTLLKEVSDRGATFKSLREAWCDSTTAMGRLLVTLLGGIAEFERELIMRRTAEGRERARAAGKRLGGPKPENQKVQPQMRILIAARLAAGEGSRKIAVEFGVSHKTVLRCKRPVVIPATA